MISKAVPACEPSASEEKRISKAAEKCKQFVEAEASRDPRVVDVLFGGSYAKETWLRGDADVDIFVRIVPSLDLQSFEELGKRLGLKALKDYEPKLRYSDHPYVEAFVDGVRVNVVPCYAVEQGRWQSAADRSPHHTEYIRQRFGAKEKGQTRLLKAFFKSVGIYGAEISVGGFSGYVSEVLILKYGDLEAVLRAAVNLRRGQVIAVNDEFDPDVVKGFVSPLIIIDPVDKRRNLGTAISPESVGKFILAASRFLSHPSIEYFGGRIPPRKAGKKIFPNILIVEFKHRQRSPDIIWGQLKRSTAAISRQLELADFSVIRSSCVTDEKGSAAMAFLLDSLKLSPFSKRKGPEVFMEKNAASFLAGQRAPPYITWVDPEARVMMLLDRKETDARAYLRSLFGKRSENSGISRDMLAPRSMLKIYSGTDRKVAGIARRAVDGIVSTEDYIFRRVRD